jgi:membrane-anchored protein YejM (alkaline phosphatase superfamily)
MWSVFLILLTSAGILLDALVFSEYRFHINQLIVEVFMSKGAAEIFNGLSPYIVTGGILLVLFFVFWIRGEWLWRVMQRKFSNPVSNWYFLVIVICLGLSHLLWKEQQTTFYGNETTIASVFPVNYQEIFFAKKFTEEAKAGVALNYPKRNLNCSGKKRPNIIMVVLENFSSRMKSDTGTPYIEHLEKHGMNFRMHLSGGGTIEDNLYRLIFGIPASYRPEANSALLPSELKKAGYELATFSEKKVPGLSPTESDWSSWAEKRKSLDTHPPAFLFFDVKASTPEEADLKVGEILAQLQSSQLLAGSAFILTGTSSSEWEPVPMSFILPDRTKGDFGHRTSSYDIVPSVMKDILGCKTPYKAYSYGKELRELPKKDWEVFGNEKSYRVVDFKNHQVIESDWKGRILSGDTQRSNLVLKASKELSRFYR